MACGDIKEHQFVRSCLAVAARQLNRVAGIAEADKVHAFDDAAIGNVKTGNQAKGDHDNEKESMDTAVSVAPTFQALQAMSQATINIGSKVRVTRVRDRIPSALVDLLQKDASGTVVDFRTVDGKGIGVVVELSNGSTCWFFDDEIAAA